MKNICFYLLFFTIYLINAQENPIVIMGEILVNEKPLNDVHIINKTLELGTITNDDGYFEILANKGDVLIISHINLEIKEYTITNNDIQTGNITISLNNKTYVLNEIVIGNTKGIFHVDKDIMPHNLPIVNAKTLNLPYAESTEVKKEKLLKTGYGKSLKPKISFNLDGILNTLSGNNKSIKEFRYIQLEDHNLTEIREKFTDGFFINQLNIKKEHINLFLNYNISSGIIQLFKKHKNLELTSVLLENSKTFSQKTQTSNSVISLNKK